MSGNSLVSRCLVASYLGGVSWVEVPCSAPAPSWNSLFDSFLEFKGFAGLPLSAEKFPRWSFWVGHPGWQFFPFLCVVNQILGGVSWVEFLGGASWLASFSLCCEPNPRWSFLGGTSWQLGVVLVKIFR